jgi:hypothetical protein
MLIFRFSLLLRCIHHYFGFHIYHTIPQKVCWIIWILNKIWKNKYGGGGFYKYSMKNILRTQSSCPLGVSIKGISRAFNWLKCLGGFLHLQKPTQALKSVNDPGNTFDFNPKWSRTLPSLIYFSWALGVEVKGICQAFNWLKCLGGFLHLKPTAGCQISTLIFDFVYGGGFL